MEDVKKAIREILREELEPLKKDMESLKTRMDSLELKVENGFRQASFERKMLKQMNLELLEDVKIIKEKVEYLTYQQAKNNREIYKLKRRTIR